MPELTIRNVTPPDLDRCFHIESIAYSGDEAASKEKISNRILRYPEGFMVLEVEGTIAGFINSGATDNVELSDEEFKELVGHNPKGPHIVILSVVVHPEFQGNGYAGMLLEHFIESMRTLKKMDVFLICQTDLISMYEKFGFKYLKQSESDHGGLSWHEMALTLKK
ncbi:GNAT family N-acetyltransferase [Pseudomaricurvus alkylphenolicus]|uniref:GNAT family N-acetyltransferase n=1 Tax=Pseudomaricurvus alkylphenolicus TaxID=1306991 RepID=UPI00142066A7|nr:GNAT family N-acetyltransferase [Pseudomaricurvus alkylphenolicus]NIB38459.1 GNAT family N-acetyltransferase [Pseudomaricurvus alkylphenolicus]